MDRRKELACRVTVCALLGIIDLVADVGYELLVEILHLGMRNL